MTPRLLADDPAELRLIVWRLLRALERPETITTDERTGVIREAHALLRELRG